MFSLKLESLESSQAKMAILLNGKAISLEIKEDLKKAIEKMPQEIRPTLGILQVGDLSESNIYVKNKLKYASDIGLNTKLIKLQQNASKLQISEAIELLNKQSTGFIVQIPMQTNQIIDSQEILDLISIDHDIDGLTSFNLDLKNPNNYFLSATASGIFLLLNKYNILYKNAKIGVIGQSKIVGYPLANFLVLKGYNVFRYNKDTPKNNIKDLDIIIVATGAKDPITYDQVKPGAVIIDVGIHRDSNNKISGDLNFNEFTNVASFITPVPGGVGPMTILALIINLLKASSLQNPIILPYLKFLKSYFN